MTLVLLRSDRYLLEWKLLPLPKIDRVPVPRPSRNLILERLIVLLSPVLGTLATLIPQGCPLRVRLLSTLIRLKSANLRFRIGELEQYEATSPPTLRCWKPSVKHPKKPDLHGLL